MLPEILMIMLASKVLIEIGETAKLRSSRRHEDVAVDETSTSYLSIYHNTTLLSSAGPNVTQTFGSSTAQPSSAGPSTTQPFSFGLSTTQPSSADPSTTQPSSFGPSTTQPSSFGPSRAQQSSFGQSKAQPSSAGPSTTQPSSLGPSLTQPPSFGPSRAHQSSFGPSTAQPSSAGPSTTQPSSLGPSLTQPPSFGPSRAQQSSFGPSTAQPSSAGPSTTQLSSFGSSTTQPSSFGLNTTQPSSFGLNTTQPSSFGLNTTQQSLFGLNTTNRTTASVRTGLAFEGNGEEFDELCGSSRYANCMKNSCRGKCGQVNQFTDPLWLCSCDSACHVYKSCCPDFETECRNNVSLSDVRQTDGTHRTMCKKIGSNTERHGHMAQSCKPGYKDIDVKQKCLKPEGLTGMAPVTDPKSGITYANYFCALCNDVKNIQQWKIIANCTGIPFGNPTGDRFIASMLNIPHNIDKGACTAFFQPTVPTDIRPCINVVDSCRSRCNNDILKQQCKEGPYDPQRLETLKFIMRNKYCVYCNNYASNKTKCSDSATSRNPTLDSYFTYSVLLEIDPDEDVNVDIAPVARLAGVGSSFKIQNKETRITKCSPPFTYHNGKCFLEETMMIKVTCYIHLISGVCKDEYIDLIWEVYDNVLGVVTTRCYRNFSETFFHVTFMNHTVDWNSILKRNEVKLMNRLPYQRFDLKRSHCIFLKILTETDLERETTTELSTVNTATRKLKTNEASVVKITYTCGLQIACLIGQMIALMIHSNRDC
ncbi:unnamed protein product [Owenia fusiformis]|uniref:Uncharacterized protein n=1 Tax=Owenia fusiformis TaxID=6347 RepID=A0A8J1Y1H4_OWEFU|nr:unnamed protein product [Owenia fusiformis]